MLRRLVFLIFMFFPMVASANSARLKDLVDFDGVRGNDLVGYGLVVGLNGTGDGIRNSPFTEEMMVGILERLGVNINGEQFQPKNVAAVLVTAVLPPFSRIGGRIDINVSTIGDAKSLLGGTLIMTPLSAADGSVYAVAQGNVLAGGISNEGEATSIVHGVPTSGSIVSGARVEREVSFELEDLEKIRISLREPDFSTARLIEASINNLFGKPVARMLDSRTLDISILGTGQPSPAHAISEIENLYVSPENTAKVVIDQRSGTIVIGREVTISSVAVAQGNLTLTIQESPVVVQPSPFSEGETIVVPRTLAGLERGAGTGIAIVPSATSLSQVVSGLNALGVEPLNMIDILKSIKAAGAIRADFIVQ
ncbi:MAG: flagellar basal body P-ring protein FlgI [Pseudomonadota bacterium]